MDAQKIAKINRFVRILTVVALVVAALYMMRALTMIMSPAAPPPQP